MSLAALGGLRLPDFLAPEAQTHVPALLWFSENYVDNHAVQVDQLRARVDLPCSHDNVAHTLLGLMDVATTEYDEALDLTRGARSRDSIMTAHSQPTATPVSRAGI